MFKLPADGQTVRTTCPYCGVGCGVLATKKSDGTVDIQGDPDHPANFGSLCSKGSALGETLDFEDRLQSPLIEGEPASWDTALDTIADAFTRTIAEHGPDSVAIYGSGQLLTEDYYVANKFIKGFVGTANMDTNSRLCMASTVAGHKRAFGSDTVPGCYEDLELADLIVLVGSNLAWCHPVLYQRIVAAKQERPDMRVVLIDPRRTVSNDLADLHLPIASDGDVALFSGLLASLARSELIDEEYVAENTIGFEQALAAVSQLDISEVAAQTGLDAADIELFFEWFGQTERAVTIFSQGVNQSTSGTDKVNAIINCHLATGRIAKPGAGPFSVTGQPNAMGGREVGGLANMLAAHMDFANPEDVDRVSRFWDAPNIATQPGLKAVDLFQALEAKKIKLVWIISTNPVVSMPDADAAKRALKSCDMVIVSDITAASDTVACANVVLPALGWGEKSGSVTNSERRISRQRPFMRGPDLARPDWWAVAEVAKRMSFETAFSYDGPHEIFAEHAALSNFENEGARGFNLGPLAEVDAQSYDDLTPVQWPVGAAQGSREFTDGAFNTPDKKARFVAMTLPALPAQTAASGSDFVINTGRVRDHWHTMTRTGKTPRLSAHMAEPFVELHPDDAKRLQIEPADLVRLSNEQGHAIGRALITDRQQVGHAFMPMHWTEQFSSAGRVDVLMAPRVDPVSGQPALKMSRAKVEKFGASWFGFAFCRHKPVDLSLAEYWVTARTDGGYRLELAGTQTIPDWEAIARTMFGVSDAAELSIFEDKTRQNYRLAFIENGLVQCALFVGPKPVAVSRQWAVGNLRGDASPSGKTILAARPAADIPDQGAIICSCFSVGVNAIVASISSGQCTSVDALGKQLKAGTNCGSCRSELQGLINDHSMQAAE